MFSVDTGEKIGPLPDIFEEDRIKDEYNYFKREFGIEIKNRISKSDCLRNELIKKLIRLDSIELRIVVDKSVGKIKKEICWPYNLHKEFNSLPRDIRNGVTSSKNKAIIKSFFAGRHKHLENRLDCEQCVDREHFTVPNWIENPSINEFNDTMEVNLIRGCKEEKELNEDLTDARFESVCEALDEVDRERTDMRLSVLNYEWLRRSSKKWSLKRCLTEIKSLGADLL
jgi:hypothetical protein